MKFLNFIILSFLFTSCSRQTCPGNVSVIRDTYKRHLIILREAKHPVKLVSLKETEDAIHFITIVSGIASQAEIGHQTAYRNKADFNKDLKLWKKWYRENRCKLTMQYADSSFTSVGLRWD